MGSDRKKCVTNRRTKHGEIIYSKESATYFGGLDFCRKRNSELARINNEKEYKTLISEAPGIGDRCFSQNYRIGLISTDHARSFKWGQGISSSKWYERFINSENLENQIQTVYLSIAQGELHTSTIDGKISVVCHSPALQIEATPELETTLADELQHATFQNIIIDSTRAPAIPKHVTTDMNYISETVNYQPEFSTFQFDSSAAPTAGRLKLIAATVFPLLSLVLIVITLIMLWKIKKRNRTGRVDRRKRRLVVGGNQDGRDG